MRSHAIRRNVWGIVLILSLIFVISTSGGGILYATTATVTLSPTRKLTLTPTIPLAQPCQKILGETPTIRPSPARTATRGPSPTPTPTSNPGGDGGATQGIPANCAEIPGDLWTFTWWGRLICSNGIEIEGPGGRKLLYEASDSPEGQIYTQGIRAEVVTSGQPQAGRVTIRILDALPPDALGPWYWKVYIGCPMGSASSGWRLFWVKP